MRLMVALMLAVAGCGGGSADVPDGSAAEDAAVEARDAVHEDATVCSTPALFTGPSPTHRALVTYDEFIVGPEPARLPAGFNSPLAVFLDDAGVLYFGSWDLLRLDLEGRLVTSSPNPTRPFDESPVYLGDVVKSPTGYGVIVSYVTQDGLGAGRFCLVTNDAWPALEDCAVLGPAPTDWGALAWDGNAFQVFTRSGATTYDSHGAWVEDRPISPPGNESWPAAAQYLADNAVVVSNGRDSKECLSETLWVLPRSLDPSSAPRLDLAPVDFVVGAGTRSTCDGTFAAFLSECVCFKRWPTPYVCYKESTWMASFLTVLGPDGAPTLLRQPVPLINTQQLAWDGEHLVTVRTTQEYVEVAVLDLQGNLVRVALLAPELGYKRFSGARIVALSPNDYILGYGVIDAMEAWVARFQLVPM